MYRAHNRYSTHARTDPRKNKLNSSYVKQFSYLPVNLFLPRWNHSDSISHSSQHSIIFITFPWKLQCVNSPLDVWPHSCATFTKWSLLLCGKIDASANVIQHGEIKDGKDRNPPFCQLQEEAQLIWQVKGADADADAWMYIDPRGYCAEGYTSTPAFPCVFPIMLESGW